jgi:hypothetical protein
LPRTFPALLKSRGFLLAGYLLLAWIASIQQWSLKRPGDPYTHYNNYVIFRQAFFHLVGHQDLYLQRLAEHWDYFRYSPSFALAFGVFAWMPDLIGLLLWNTLNAGVLFLGWTRLPLQDDRVRLAAGWFAAVEVMTALQNAQSNVLIAGLLLLAFSFLERRQMAFASLMIVVAAFTKLFGLVAFSLFLLYPEKKRFILFSALWGIVAGLLPLAVVSPAELARLYESWWRLLLVDYADSSGLSVMAWLQSWFHLSPPKTVVTLLGIALFCWPLIYVQRYRDFHFRLLFLCNVLIWVVIFNHKAESSTYVIAICGVALWYFSRPTWFKLVLVSLAFIFTCLSPTDAFPASLSATFFVPYSIKAVPCILIWGTLTYELIRRDRMKKGTALIVAALGAIVCGGAVTSAQTSAPVPDFGTVSGRVYTNNYFGLRLTLPSQWQVEGEATKSRIREGGKAAASSDDKSVQAAREASLERTFNFLTVSRLEAGNTAPSALFIVGAERLLSPVTSTQYMVGTKNLLLSLASSRTLESDVHLEPVAGREFAVVEVSNGGVNQKYYALIMKGYALFFVSTFRQLEDMRTMNEVIRSVTLATP